VPYLVAAAALGGIVSAVTLFGLAALTRKFRGLGGAITRPARSGSQLPPQLSPPGSRPGDFLASTTAGEPVTRDGLSGSRALIGFFAVPCTPCLAQLPDFAELAKTITGGPRQVLAVVPGPADVMAGFADAAAESAAWLEGVASVVLETARREATGPVARAFSVSAWPSFYLLGPDGTIESSSHAVSLLVTGFASAKSPVN
jgi:hypothetical protein